MQFEEGYKVLCFFRDDYSESLSSLCSISTLPPVMNDKSVMVDLYRAKLKHDLSKDIYLKFLAFMQAKFPGKLADTGFKVSP